MQFLTKTQISKVGIRFKFRFISTLPLIFFLARLFELMAEGKTAHILWICHTSNLLIFLGLLFGWDELVRISVLWLILGAPMWPIEIARTGIMEITSIGTHYLGLMVGLFALKDMGMGRRTWLYAMVWFLILQQVARLFTPIEYNVNLAHAIYPGWEQFFSGYWPYWIVTGISSAMGLWLISKILVRLYGKSNLTANG